MPSVWICSSPDVKVAILVRISIRSVLKPTIVDIHIIDCVLQNCKTHFIIHTAIESHKVYIDGNEA